LKGLALTVQDYSAREIDLVVAVGRAAVEHSRKVDAR
jgi:hypothetical protein